MKDYDANMKSYVAKIESYAANMKGYGAILCAGQNGAYRHIFACVDNLIEVEPRTSDPFLPRTPGNLEEVAECMQGRNVEMHNSNPRKV